MPANNFDVLSPSPINRYRVNPGGYIVFWTDRRSTGPAGEYPGGEGLLNLTIIVEEDRGAVMASGSMFVQDNTPVTPPPLSLINWGDKGSGPFAINGGRAF